MRRLEERRERVEVVVPSPVITMAGCKKRVDFQPLVANLAVLGTCDTSLGNDSAGCGR